MKLTALAACAAAFAVSGAAHAAVTVSYEAPGVQDTTVALAKKGVETFDGRSGTGFTTDFGTGGKITGTYSNLNLYSADQYGGAGGTGQYAVTFDNPGYQLDLTTTLPAVNYIGLWVSAVDAGNSLSLYKGGNAIYTLNGSDIVNALADNWHYKGNPTGAFEGQDYGEKFVFVNLTSSEGFDRLVFSGYKGGFETDNHTVGYAPDALASLAGRGGAVPEPAAWALMILGFGGVGSLLRRRRAMAFAA